MGYQIIKKIDFNQTRTKPVGILKGAILEKENGERFIQLKLCNTGNDILSKASVEITCYEQDHTVIGTQTYTYNKIFIRSGDIFGTDVAIPLEFCNADTFSVEFNNDCERLQVSTSKIKKPYWNVVDVIITMLSTISAIIGIILLIIIFSGLLNRPIYFIPICILIGILVVKKDTILIKYQLFWLKLNNFFENLLK